MTNVVHGGNGAWRLGFIFAECLKNFFETQRIVVTVSRKLRVASCAPGSGFVLFCIWGVWGMCVCNAERLTLSAWGVTPHSASICKFPQYTVGPSARTL